MAYMYTNAEFYLIIVLAKALCCRAISAKISIGEFDVAKIRADRFAIMRYYVLKQFMLVTNLG
jgi:hypothetical protein